MASRLRVIFFGTGEFAVPSLEQVAERHAVVTCVTQPDRPQGRGLKRAPSPVKAAAQRLGLAVAQPERLRADVVPSPQPDIGVVAAYGRLIPPTVLQATAHGILGVHPSLLPQYRGAAPVAWAILNGDAATGVTIFRLTERMDAGHIVEQRRVSIAADEDAHALSGRLARLGAEAVTAALKAVAEGRAAWTPQDESKASAAPKLTKAQGRIDWGKPAHDIERLVRAVTPWPGAVCAWRGASLRVWEARVAGGASGAAAPGTVVEIGPVSFTVATGRGRLVVATVQPAGRRRMSAQEFLAGHPLRPGDRLGPGGVS